MKMQYLFSEFRASEFNELYQEISQIFEISKDQLNALYLIMGEELEKEGYPARSPEAGIFFFLAMRVSKNVMMMP